MKSKCAFQGGLAALLYSTLALAQVATATPESAEASPEPAAANPEPAQPSATATSEAVQLDATAKPPATVAAKERAGSDRALQALEPTTATRESSPSFLQAPTSLTAETTGNAEIKAGLGYGVAWGSRHVSAIVVGRVATSEGISKLFSANQDEAAGPPDWSVGLSLNLAGMFLRTAMDRVEDARLYAAALALCGVTGMPDFKDLCPAGQALFDNKSTPSSPKYMVTLGGRFGTKDLQYLEDKDSDGDYAPGKLTAENYALGASGYGTRLPVFFEGLANFQSNFKPSTVTVEYCSDEGTVGGVPAVSCKKGTWGSPMLDQKLTAVVGVGLVDADISTWRAGLRVTTEVPTAEANPTKVKLSFGLPAYFRFADLREGLKYKGLIGLIPQLEVLVPDEGRASVAAIVNISVLGQRDLFSAEFDRL